LLWFCLFLFFLSFLKLYPYYMVLIYTYQCMMLSRFWTVSNYSPRELKGQGSVALTFDGELMSAGLWIPIICLKAHYMILMLSMVAVSVTQIRAVILVSDTINSESCNGQIFVNYVENLSKEEMNTGCSSKTVLLRTWHIIPWSLYVKFWKPPVVACSLIRSDDL
jgi:hypothetical protein